MITVAIVFGVVAVAAVAVSAYRWWKNFRIGY
jgi:hypothetical protein